MGDRPTEITKAQFDALSREEQKREIAKYWAKLDALGGIINLIDPNDPMWLTVDLPEDGDKDA